MVNFLISSGGCVGAVAQDSMQALHFAAQRGHDDVVNLLLLKGSNAKALVKGKKDAADLALSKGHATTACILHNFSREALKAAKRPRGRTGKMDGECTNITDENTEGDKGTAEDTHTSAEGDTQTHTHTHTHTHTSPPCEKSKNFSV
eukprot:GHVR01004257.1.p1 GENE.GHVR01004257.1~~GHVR01004257.1.p1  ORF type:complete len:147 (+),score=76.80 GHVR01004257.1:99-539(+)